MMLIFSITVMCLYLYSECLVYRVLKKTYFKEHLSVVASKYRICDMDNNTQEFKLFKCSILNHVFSQWKRHDLWHQWNKALLEKALWHQWNIPHGSQLQWFYKRLFIQVVMVKYKNIMVKDIEDTRYNVRRSIKDTMSIKIQFLYFIMELVP